MTTREICRGMAQLLLADQGRAALAGRFSISAPIVIAGRSTVVKVAGNRRGATSVGKPVAAIN
ncbi:MAG: hypothetical protein ACRD8U_24960, partial [Pyrinomonadaceae bacterium]